MSLMEVEDVVLGPLVINRRQQVQTLKYILHNNIRKELDEFFQQPTCQHLDPFPFLQHLHLTWIQRFPLFHSGSANEDEQAFWKKVEDLLQILKGMNVTAPLRSQSGVDRMKSRILKLLVVLYKDILRPTCDREGLRLQEEQDNKEYLHWLSSQHVSEDEPFSISTEDIFKVDIVSCRVETESDGKTYENFVVETRFGNRIGRMKHRYSDFLLFHETIQKAFPNIQVGEFPRKKRLKRHTKEFLEIRRRELNSYLKNVCQHKAIQKSADVACFLLAGEATEWTPAELQLKDEQHQVDCDVEAHFANVVTFFRNMVSHDTLIPLLKELYPTLKRANTIDQLPEQYRRILREGKPVMAYFLYAKFHLEVEAEQTLDQWKTIYRLTPFTAINGMLSIFPNPVRMLQEMMSLFFSKPLKKNLCQLMISETKARDPTSNAEALAQVRKRVNQPDVSAKISNFVAYCTTVPNVLIAKESHREKEIMETILTFPSVPPVLPLELVSAQLSDPEHVSLLYSQYNIELKQADLAKILEFCGDDKVIALIRELIPMLFKRMMELYQSADLGGLISIIKDMTNKIIDTAENRLLTPSECVSAYEAIIDEVERPLYEYIHQLALNPQSAVIEDIIDWFITFLSVVQRDSYSASTVVGAGYEHFDVNDHLLHDSMQNMEYRTELMAEIAQLDEYFFKRKLQRHRRKAALKQMEREQAIVEHNETAFAFAGGNYGNVDVSEQFGLNEYLSDDDTDGLIDTRVLIRFEDAEEVTLPRLPLLSAVSLSPAQFKLTSTFSSTFPQSVHPL